MLKKKDVCLLIFCDQESLYCPMNFTDFSKQGWEGNPVVGMAQGEMRRWKAPCSWLGITIVIWGPNVLMGEYWKVSVGPKPIKRELSARPGERKCILQIMINFQRFSPVEECKTKSYFGGGKGWVWRNRKEAGESGGEAIAAVMQIWGQVTRDWVWPYQTGKGSQRDNLENVAHRTGLSHSSLTGGKSKFFWWHNPMSNIFHGTKFH